MKRFFTIALLMSCFVFAEAQTAKKYVFLEHFTNTYCGNCSSRNPAFYNTISNYEDLVHHLAVHPKVPYDQCQLYNANTADNEARRVHHNVTGTPRVYLNGTRTQSNPLIRSAQLDTESDLVTSLGVQVSANINGTNQSGTVEVFTTGDSPSGNLKLFMAAVEKTLDFNAPNGEKTHHDVLRKFLSSNTGDAFTPAATGESVSVSYNFDFDGTWVADEMYVLAWVEDVDTKEILNSGSQFDPPVNISTGTQNVFTLPITVSPNPVSDILNLEFTKPVVGQVIVQSLSGKELYREGIKEASLVKQLSVSGLKNGAYIVRVDTEDGSGILKFIKE